MASEKVTGHRGGEIMNVPEGVGAAEVGDLRDGEGGDEENEGDVAHKCEHGVLSIPNEEVEGGNDGEEEARANVVPPEEHVGD